MFKLLHTLRFNENGQLIYLLLKDMIKNMIKKILDSMWKLPLFNVLPKFEVL